MKHLLILAAATLMPVAAFAHDGAAVRDAYARSTNPKTAALFMVIENHREVACQLTGATSDAAERVELHTHSEKDGVMSMRKIEGGIDIPAGGEHALARGGDHVMLMGLAKPVADGDVIKATLNFDQCDPIEIEVKVDNAHEPDPAAAHGEHANH